MISRFVYWIRLKWSIFAYNFQWENYTFLFHGNIARVSAFVPLFGYLIIFNDGISQYLTFEKLAPKEIGTLFISSDARLRLVYFGLIMLGVSELIYVLRRPHVIRLGKDFFSFKEKVLSLASPRYFSEIHYSLKSSGFDPYTQGGKYYDRDYEDFIEVCTGARPGTSIKEAYEKGKSANWDEARNRFEPLLTGMLEEKYFMEGRKRRFSLSLALFFALLGYIFLAIPSIELLLRVIKVTLF